MSWCHMYSILTVAASGYLLYNCLLYNFLMISIVTLGLQREMVCKSQSSCWINGGSSLMDIESNLSFVIRWPFILVYQIRSLGKQSSKIIRRSSSLVKQL
jgi:hypothetical protein